ncbi:MAG: LptF/LptG family permease [Treponema sp.]|nr:LptF/LptG family permease [Treponema sp.]
MKKIMILDIYLLRQFIPIFLIAISLFSFIILLIDLFSNLIQFINNDVPIASILYISICFIPKSISFALPISLLFAAAYVLGDLFEKNELTCVFSSGIPFWRFCFSLLIVGFITSILSFFYEDKLVIPAVKVKNELTRRALNQYVAGSGNNIVIITRGGRLIYLVDYFDYDKKILNDVIIVEKDVNGRFLSQIRAPSADWNETHWEFRNAVIYQYDDEILRVNPLAFCTSYTEHPDMFRRRTVVFQELPAREARVFINDLRYVGLPHYQAQADYFHRYSFATTSFIVMILSVSMGGRFKKNILLMSLFTSLAVAVIFYIVEMLSMTMAGLNYFHPFIGAWFPIVLFIVIGILLLRSAKT